MADNKYGDLKGVTLQPEALDKVVGESTSEPSTPTNPFLNDNLTDVQNTSLSPTSSQTHPQQIEPPIPTQTLQQTIESPTSPQSPPQPIESPTSPQSPPQPIESPTSPQTSPVENLREMMVPTNIKGTLMEFCGKNKYELPAFKREVPKGGAYTTNLTWSPPNDGTHDSVVFFEEATGKTKKDAESEAAFRMLEKVRNYSFENKVMEQGNFKGDLQQIIAVNSSRFGMPKYNTNLQGIGIFSCSLVVADVNGKEDIITTGRSVGKKTAEKEAAGRMLSLIQNILKTSPIQTDEFKNDLERLEARRIHSFPDYRLEYIADKQDEEGCVYLLKSCSLVLKRDDFPSIVVASCSGTTDEEAMLICAKLCLQHIIKIREIMMSQQPK